MRLQEYFKAQHTFTLTHQHKDELFRQITQKRFQQGVAKWRFLTYKKVSYTFIALVIVLFTFGGVMIERNGGIDNFFFSSDPINP
jgi:ABC-type transport system involved in multi-copper enzyme maturation permease subunit